MATIVVDPGHGGLKMVGNSGPNNATGPSGTLEKNVTLEIGVSLSEWLANSGHRVLMTRNDDRNLGLDARAALARDNAAAVFVSIHLNGSSNPGVQGTETWVHSGSTVESRLLAASIQQQLVGATGLSDRGVRSKGLGVLSMLYHSPATAACLAEVSFLTDPNEDARLKKSVYRNKVAAALGQGVLGYLNGATTQPANPIPDGDPNGDADA